MLHLQISWASEMIIIHNSLDKTFFTNFQIKNDNYLLNQTFQNVPLGMSLTVNYIALFQFNNKVIMNGV